MSNLPATLHCRPSQWQLAGKNTSTYLTCSVDPDISCRRVTAQTQSGGYYLGQTKL